jgi:curved DNA-binding protein CbpA
MTDPFRALGLSAGGDVTDGDLTDDDIRAAWRRAAAATHPDRDDGGDPAAFAAAAAAYTVLRTRAGRSEALADRREHETGGRTRGHVPRPIVDGRPVRLALRALAAGAASWLAVAALGWQPASAAVIAGALTWLLRTGRSDLA